MPVAGATSAISTFVWLLGAVVSLHRDDDRRARDGRVHPAAAGRAAGDSGAAARASRIAPPVLQGPLFGIHVSSLLFAYASFALACVHRHHLRAAVQGDQGEASRVLLRAAAVAAGARPDEPAGDRHRLDVPDDRPGRRRDLGGAGARLRRAIRACRRCRCRIRRSSSRCVCWAVYSFELFAARRIGWGGRRAAYLSALGFAIVLLNFVPISYFLTNEPQFLRRIRIGFDRVGILNSMHLLLVGISHRTAPVELRERVDFQARGARARAARAAPRAARRARRSCCRPATAPTLRRVRRCRRRRGRISVRFVSEFHGVDRPRRRAARLRRRRPRRRAASVPRRRRARLAGRRRAADSRPGEGGAHGRSDGADRRPGAQPAVPLLVRRRQARADRNRPRRRAPCR